MARTSLVHYISPSAISIIPNCNGSADDIAVQVAAGTKIRVYSRADEALGMATHSETGEPMVVYRALYGDQKVWVRPAAMWNDLILRGNIALRRFSRMEE